MEAALWLRVRFGIGNELPDFAHRSWLQRNYPTSRHVGYDARAFGNAWFGIRAFIRKD